MEVADMTIADASDISMPSDTSTERDYSTNHRSSLTDWIIPPLVILYIVTGFVYTTRTVYQQYLVDHLKLISFLPQLYLASICIFLPIILCLYLSLYLLPQYHSAPPAVPPQQVLDRSIPFECADREGGYPRCWKDECNGRWKPSRVRHCGICKRCRVGFDHCCPWLATCVTTSTYLPFLLFLSITPVAVFFLLLPLAKPLFAHASEVWAFARDSEGPITMRWFNWKWSWVLGIGPVGRLMVGFIWACWVWNKRPVESWESGGGLFLSLIGVLVALIAVGLFISTSLSINRGISPIESRIYLNYRRIDPRLYNAAFPPSPPPLTERLALNSVSSHTLLSVSRADPRVLIWIPHPTVKGRGKAVYTRPDEKPFDLGWRENWKTVWREGIRDGFRVWSRGSVSDSAGASVDVSSSGNEARKRGLIALNENVLHRLRYEASLAFDEEDEEEEQAQYGSDDEGDLVVL